MTVGIRLQILALLVLLFICINYFSAKRRKTRVHRLFTLTMIIALANVVFDSAYTAMVHRYHQPYDLFYRIFGVTLLAFFALVYFYTVGSARENGAKIGYVLPNLAHIPYVISVVLVIFGKIDYFEHNGWYNGFGIGLVGLWICSAVYITCAMIIVFLNRRILSSKFKLVVGFLIFSLLFTLVVQSLDMENIVTSLGIAFTVLAIHLLVENPDTLLIEQLQYEKDRANAANQSKSSFVAHVSHEIRTPINAILGMNEMIIRESREETSVQYAKDASSAAYALYGTINDVLDISKIDSGKMDIVPAVYRLDYLLYDIISKNKLKLENKKLELYAEVNPSIPCEYYGDDLRIKQVLNNLLAHAIRYTHEGFVRLIVDGDYQGEYMRLRFQVKDTGVGIKEEEIAKLLPGEDRNAMVNGRGGLSIKMDITKRLLRLMGSKLQVNSAYGEGSILSFALYQRIVNADPIGDFEKFAKNQNKSSETGFRAPRAKLLLVDDNALNRRVFTSLLRGTQMMIDEAQSGFECLDRITKEQYDIIFLDHMMPEMDGLETIKRIKASREHLNRQTPIVMLTANAGESSAEDYRLYGFDGYLSKPIFNNELKRIIINLLPAYKLDSPVGMKPDGAHNQNWKESLPSIRGIDWDEAVSHLRTQEALFSALRDFYHRINSEASALDALIGDLEAGNNLNDFKAKIHALGASAELLGLLVLSEGAGELEVAAMSGDCALVRQKYPYLINYYRSLEEKLAIFDVGRKQRSQIDFPQVISLVKMVKLEMEEMNKQNALEALDEIREYEFPSGIDRDLNMLAAAIDDFDSEVLDRVSDQLIKSIHALWDEERSG